MSRASVFTLPVGRHVDPRGVRGYPIDLSEKAEQPGWPPPWFPFPGYHRFIAAGQWGLGAFERWLETGDSAWLDGVVAAARHLVETQERAPGRLGCWLEPEPYPHTFRMQGPWISAMAQGQCASVLVRAHAATDDETFAEAARLALVPTRVDIEAGGASALLDGASLPQEYPTVPPSHVLNGAIYALYGVFDVWRGLDDAAAGEQFRAAVPALARSLHRWDLGYWSRYDLYPHRGPVEVNVASASYHALHVNQLRALHLLAPHEAFHDTAARWDDAARRPACRARAFAHKAAFRLAIPRHRRIADALPWADAPHRSHLPAA